MRKILSTLFICLLIASCGNKDSITIEGTLENGAGKVVYLEDISPDAVIFLDSITLDKNGHFKTHVEVPYKTFITVHVTPEDYIVLLPDMGEHISLTGVYDSLSRSYHLKGGHESQLLWQLQDYTNDGNRQLRQLVAQDAENRAKLSNGELNQKEFEKAHNATDSTYLSIFGQQQKYVANMIEENLGSLTTLIALYKPFNDRPLIDPETGFEFYVAVLDGLEASLPDNPHTLSFRNEVERLRYQYGR